MSDVQYQMDNISMREIRGTISRLEALVRNLEKVTGQQESKISQIMTQLINIGQSTLGMQFWGNQMSASLEKGHFNPLGVAMPVMGAVSLGIGRGLQLAAESQKLGDAIRRGEIQFGTEADRQRWAIENGLRMTLYSIFG